MTQQFHSWVDTQTNTDTNEKWYIPPPGSQQYYLQLPVD